MANRTKTKGAASGDDIGRKLLQSVREMKATKRARVTSVEVNEVSQARQKSGLSQAQFAEVLGISGRR